MKQKLIKLSDNHYVIVDDSEIKDNEWYLSSERKILQFTGRKVLGDKLPKDCKKITHSTQSIYENKVMRQGVVDGIKTISLSEVEEAIYGYSVEKMARDIDKSKCRNFRREHTLKEVYEGIEDGFLLGFNAHKELVKDKLFNISDMIHAYNQGTNDGVNYQSLINDEDFEDAELFMNDSFEEFKKNIAPKN